MERSRIPSRYIGDNTFTCLLRKHGESLIITVPKLLRIEEGLRPGVMVKVVLEKIPRKTEEIE